MLSEQILDKIDNPQPHESEIHRENEDLIEINFENIHKEIYHDKWIHRKNVYSFLKHEFSNPNASQQLIDFFNAKLAEMLNEKNISALEELLLALKEYLSIYQIPKSIIQYIISFFSSNIPNKRNEKVVNQIIQICADLNQEITLTTITKKLDPDGQSLQQIHILSYFLMLLEKSEITSPVILKNLFNRLKSHLSCPNQKVRKMSLEIMKEMCKLILDDFSIVQKALFDGIKETHIKELQFSLMEEKKQGAMIIFDVNTNLGSQHFIHHHNFDSDLKPPKNDSFIENSNNHQNQQKIGINMPEEKSFRNPSRAFDQNDFFADHSQKKGKLLKMDQPREPVLPEKLLEIIHLKKIDERIDVLQNFKSQLSMCKKFNTIFPNQIYPILINELKEANYLLYSIVLEVFAIILKQSKNKQVINQSQVKQVVQLSGLKYNLKASVNPIVLDIIDLFIKKEYIQVEILTKFLLDEIAQTKIRNVRQCFLDWFSNNLLKNSNCVSFKDFNKKMKTTKEAKIYNQKFNDEFKNSLIDFIYTEIFGFVVLKLTSFLENEKQVQNKQQIKDTFSRIKECISNFIKEGDKALDNSFDEMSENEQERTKLLKKLTNVFTQLTNSSEKEIIIGRELFINTIFQIIEHFEKLDSIFSQKVVRAVEKICHQNNILNQKAAMELILIISILFEEESTKISYHIFDILLKSFGINSFVEILGQLYLKPSMKKNHSKINQGFIDVLNNLSENELENAYPVINEFLSEFKLPSKRFLTVFSNFFISKVDVGSEKMIGKRNSSIRPNLQSEKLVQNVRTGNSLLPKIKSTQKPSVYDDNVENNRFEEQNDQISQLPKISQKVIEASNPKIDPQGDYLPESKTDVREIYKNRLFSQLSSIQNLSTLRDFITKISNSYKMLHKLLNTITFKEISSHLEQILEILVRAKDDIKQTLQDFVVVILSLLMDIDKEKFFVLTLTFFSKLKQDHTDCLIPLFSQSKNPFRCYKYAFNLVNRQFEESPKANFILNTFEFMIKKLNSAQISLEDSFFCNLLEIIVTIANWHKIFAPSAFFSTEKIKKNEDLAKEILKSIFKQFTQKMVFDRFESELSSTAKVYTLFCDSYSLFLNSQNIKNNDIIKNESQEKNYFMNSNDIRFGDGNVHSSHIPNVKNIGSVNIEMSKEKNQIQKLSNIDQNFMHDNNNNINNNDYKKTNVEDESIDHQNESQSEDEIDQFSQNQLKNSSFHRMDKSDVDLSQENKHDQNNKSVNSQIIDDKQSDIDEKPQFKEQTNQNKLENKKSIENINNTSNFKSDLDKKSDFIEENEEQKILKKQKSVTKKLIFKENSRNSSKEIEISENDRFLEKKQPKSISRKYNESQNNVLFEKINQEKKTNVSIEQEKEINLENHMSYKNVRAMRKNRINSVDRKSPFPAQENEKLNKMTSLESKRIREFEANPNIFGHQKADPSIGISIKEVHSKKSIHNIPNNQPKAQEEVKFGIWRETFMQSAKIDGVLSEQKIHRFDNIHQTTPIKTEVDKNQINHQKMNKNQVDLNEIKKNTLNPIFDKNFDLQQNIHKSNQISNVFEHQSQIIQLQENNSHLSIEPLKKGYVNDIFTTNFLKSEQQKQSPKNAVSTQTDMQNLSEEEKKIMIAKIKDLSDKNVKIMNQLYTLSQTNDEIREENKILLNKLTVQSQTSFQERENDNNHTFESFNQTFAELIIECQTISPSIFTKLIQKYTNFPEDEKERLLFDFKFFVLDSGAIDFVQFDNYCQLLNFVISISLIHTLKESSSSENLTRLVHTILDLLLKVPQKFILLGMLVNLIWEHIPKYGTAINDDVIMYLKLVIRIAKKVSDVFVKEVSKLEGVFEKSLLKNGLFKILVGIFKIFLKNPPEELNEKTMNLEFYDEVFKEMRKMCDQISKVDLGVSKQFVKIYKVQHAQKAFLRYMENFINQLDN